MTWFAFGGSQALATDLSAVGDTVLGDVELVGAPPSGPWPCTVRDATVVLIDEFQPEGGAERVLKVFAVCGDAAESWHRFKVVYRQKPGRPPRNLDWRLDDGGPFGATALADLLFCLEAVRWTAPEDDPVSVGDPNQRVVMRGPDPDLVVVGTRERPVSGGALALFSFLLAFDDKQRDPVAVLSERRARLEELVRVQPPP